MFLIEVNHLTSVQLLMCLNQWKPSQRQKPFKTKTTRENGTSSGLSEHHQGRHSADVCGSQTQGSNSLQMLCTQFRCMPTRPVIFSPLKLGGCKWRAAKFIWGGFEHPKFEAESQHLSHIAIVVFHILCAGANDTGVCHSPHTLYTEINRHSNW